jgi:hypothetical protein
MERRLKLYNVSNWRRRIKRLDGIAKTIWDHHAAIIELGIKKRQWRLLRKIQQYSIFALAINAAERMRWRFPLT